MKRSSFKVTRFRALSYSTKHKGVVVLDSVECAVQMSTHAREKDCEVHQSLDNRDCVLTISKAQIWKKCDAFGYSVASSPTRASTSTSFDHHQNVR